LNRAGEIRKLGCRMNRVTECFAALRRARRKGVIVYFGAGDPDLGATRELALAFAGVGVDLLELGVPFSDPVADGPVNQLAAQRGLDSGTTPVGVLETVAQIRQASAIPIVLYLYFNLVHRHGIERFADDAARVGVDGLLILDLPPEEAGFVEKHLSRAGIASIYLVAPTTPETRIAEIVRRGSGFVYYISREGVTGMQSQVASNLEERVALLRKHTELPVAIGFGVSNPDQARRVAGMADAVVVGSAVVDRIARLGRSPELVSEVSGFVKTLVDAVKRA